MAEYNIGKAFERIENELISSMIGNLKHHRAEETKEGFQWSQWQVEQLKALENYKKKNKEKFSEEFLNINENIGSAIKKAYEQGGMDQEIKILKALQKGYTGYTRKFSGISDVSGEFFKVNERKINELINATVKDMEKAETAVLRMANDKYRKIIFDAQVYANAGGTTYEKAVDMATHDFLSAGINCIEYKNGARHTISDYADMAIKTANKRAYLRGEGTKRAEWGIHTVIVNKRGNACPLCLPFVGKVLIDDVYSGGSSKSGKYPLLSTAVSQGFLHPRCKDSYTTYFEGISTPPKDEELTQDDIENVKEQTVLNQKKQNAENQAKRMDRLAKYSLDKDNQKMYSARSEQWKKQAGNYTEELKKSVEKSNDSGIIKSLDVDDFNLMSESHDILPEVSNVIANTIKEFEDNGNMYILDMHFGDFIDEESGKSALLQIIPNRYGFVDINVNSKVLGGKPLNLVDEFIRKTSVNLPQNLKEAVVHECGHAKAYYKKTIKQIKSMNEAIKNKGVKGISAIAEYDGAECIAEVEVLKYRGSYVPKQAEVLYRMCIEPDSLKAKTLSSNKIYRRK